MALTVSSTIWVAPFANLPLLLDELHAASPTPIVSPVAIATDALRRLPTSITLPASHRLGTHSAQL
jgi:hypothetical protein